MENKEMNIFQRMLKVTEEIQKVAKNLNVQINQNASYKAVSEVDVLEAVKPIEIKYGVYSYPRDREIIETSILETEKTYNGNKTVSKNLFMRIKTTYRFVNVDKPSEFIEMVTYADGIDSGDKGTGKAMTYADKYALMKAYKICTGEDLDAEASGELKKELATPKQVSILEKNYMGANLEKLLKVNNVEKLSDLPKQKASELISKIYEKGNQNV